MKHPLDLQLEAGLRGDFDEGWRLCQTMNEADPRVAFNKGWYVLRQGNLLEGHKYLDAGRPINVFGNRHIGSSLPIWDGGGRKGQIILLSLEGGFGDQICGVRWARDLAERGARVVVSCAGVLAPILRDAPGVSAIVQHEAALGVYHDYWLPSMSAVVAFGYGYGDLRGEAYLPRTAAPIPGRVGLRWAGNQQFEHEQHRVFPPEMLFDAAASLGAPEYISLQLDEAAKARPNWVAEVPLGNWSETVAALSTCELVITSCTSVAHLSGAMGIPTWIIIPVLGYYLWALPGSVTPYYDSVRLFRQERHGDWDAPFEQIAGNMIPSARAA